MKGRFKDRDWDLANKATGNIETWERVTIAVLMDLRDELKRLNSVLQCPNFIAVPSKLDAIRAELVQVRKNTRKRRKPKAVGKPKLRVVR